MATTAPQLAYEPTPAWRRRRGFRRFVLPVLLVLAAAAASWLLPTLWRNAQHVTLQRRCLNYRPPPSPRVVFVDEPTMAAPLLKQPNYFPDFSGGGRAVYHNPLWRAYAGRAAPAVFMHRRTSPGGNDRLVVVQLATLSGGGDVYNRIFFVPHVDGIATLKGRPSLAARAAPLRGLEMYRNAGDWTAVVEGVPDPADPSHFTIDYALNNVPDTIDGWLNDDDTVTLAPRTGVTADPGSQYILWSPAGAPLPNWVAGRAPFRDAATRPMRPGR